MTSPCLDRHWSRVALLIADWSGIEPGETVSDRYEQARKEDPAAQAYSREIARALADIADAIADLTHGRAHASTVQNVSAWVRQMEDRCGGDGRVAVAGDDLLRACEALALDQAACAASLTVGIYPEAAERASGKLQAFGAALQRKL